MDVEEYIELYYPNKSQTRYNIRHELNEYFRFFKIKPEAYVKLNRDFKKDILIYNGNLLKKISKKTGKLYAPKTINIHISAIRQYLEEHDIILSPRFWKKINQRGKGNETILEDRIPTREELGKILTHADARNRAFFMTMLSSGMREEELCRINIKDFDFESEPVTITIPATISKTKKKRKTFCSIEAKNCLLEWLKLRDEYIKTTRRRAKGLYEYLEDKTGKKVSNISQDRMFPYEPNSPQRWWNRLIKKADFTDKDINTGYYILHLYTLRKFFITKMKKYCNILMV